MPAPPLPLPAALSPRTLLVYAAALWSGFFVMGVELLGGRLLAPFFGNSIFVWGGVIAVFMACLSVGYLLGGRLSLHQPTLRRHGSLLGSLLLFGAPTVLSGMISPYAVRLLVSALDSSGLSAGRLYFVSTLGSAAGTILTSFYLVLYLEIHTILLCFMGVSALVGSSLVLADRLWRRASP